MPGGRQSRTAKTARKENQNHWPGKKPAGKEPQPGGNGYPANIPNDGTRLVVGEADLVDEEAHELRRRERRVGVVHLDRNLGRRVGIYQWVGTNVGGVGWENQRHFQGVFPRFIYLGGELGPVRLFARHAGAVLRRERGETTGWTPHTGVLV